MLGGLCLNWFIQQTILLLFWRIAQVQYSQRNNSKVEGQKQVFVEDQVIYLQTGELYLQQLPTLLSFTLFIHL